MKSCADNPCQNGATCANGTAANTYTCTCKAGYTGTNCEANIDDCSPNPCKNGGTCTDGVNSHTCTCAAGYTGANCETNANDCSPNPCKNGGTCTDGVNSHTCTCAAGYTGADCEININDCSPNPCKNGGTCTDGVNSHTCTCADGYTGADCETNINDCSPNPCQNGGTCTDGVNSHSCACVNGYTGTNCETAPNYCASNPCKNGGTCSNGTGTFACACASGWAGPTCEFVPFVGLGMLSSSYSDASRAAGVSADGTIVVGGAYGAFESVSQGFRWTSTGGMKALTSPLGNPDFVATAISGGGIVGATKFGQETALYWSGATESDLPNLATNGASANAISDNGVIVGFAYDSNGDTRAVRWASKSATPTRLDSANTYAYSNAHGVSADGSVVVGEMTGGAFRWTSSGGFSALPGTNPQAFAVSADGSITVGSTGSSPVPARWSGTSTPTTLGAGDGQALAINATGTVIVGSSTAGAFVWDATNGRRLIATLLTSAGANLAGWSLSSAKGVASDGKTIVGDGSHNGTPEAWIAHLP